MANNSDGWLTAVYIALRELSTPLALGSAPLAISFVFSETLPCSGPVRNYWILAFALVSAVAWYIAAVIPIAISRKKVAKRWDGLGHYANALAAIFTGSAAILATLFPSACGL